ncbi:MAG: bifunctional deaminase-reductase domain protein [Sphingobacteriales bacterium]|nr:bifunctional deaminase-reductase domain protein [Sphingobacteriales bacterium]
MGTVQNVYPALHKASTIAIIVRRYTTSNQNNEHSKLNMRKIIAAINMTIDGFCDHTAIIPDEEIHQHYADLLSNADAVLYGRITYQLMQYWQDLVKNPSGEKSMDDFAMAMDKIPKIVFSRTLKNTEWESAKLANRNIEEEILELKQQ